jgi:hypothetical protein
MGTRALSRVALPGLSIAVGTIRQQGTGQMAEIYILAYGMYLPLHLAGCGTTLWVVCTIWWSQPTLTTMQGDVQNEGSVVCASGLIQH